MIIPQFWAEARQRVRTRHRQVTVRRFGWSDISPEAAQAHAEERTRAALQRILEGDHLPRREFRHAYNGGEGVPIREEIVERHGDTIITRNGYGALCLNTPNVLFVDIDTERPANPLLWLGVTLILGGLAVAGGYWSGSRTVTAAGLVAAWIFSGRIADALAWFAVKLAGGREQQARRRIERFLEHRPDWMVRVYRTPAGIRVLALHRTFDPGDPEVAECFQALAADPLYVRMCQNQRCFRARLTPKPWRIGMEDHLRPARGTWPVAAEQMPLREEWIERYTARSEGYAACHFIEEFGYGTTDRQAEAVQQLHDRWCRADSTLPLA